MNAIQKYLKMQRDQYEDSATTPEDVVGYYKWNETAPYETLLLYVNGDLRYPIFEDTKELVALDFGCGPGRMISRMSKLFKRVDGVDISPRLIEAAKEKCPGSHLFVSSGNDLGDAPSSTYDFVYSTIAMQHIAVHSVRMNILKEMRRVLKPGGKINLQFAFDRHFPYSDTQCEEIVPGDTKVVLFRKTHHASWREDRTDAEFTNGGCDVGIGTADLPIVIEDFEKYFKDVRYWFFDHSFHHRRMHLIGVKMTWSTHQIFIEATRK